MAFWPRPSSTDKTAPIDSQSLHWLLGSLCALNRIPFDGALFKQQFPPPYTRATLYAAAEAFGLKLGEIGFKASKMPSLSYPIIGFLKTEAISRSDSPTSTAITKAAADSTTTILVTCLPVLILKAEHARVLYVRAGAEAPDSAELADFEQTFEPVLLLVRNEKSEQLALDSDGNPLEQGVSPPSRPFGFRWFIPELLKHKSIWRDVLLASLAIQLVGLTTPLMTQVIVDKVVVHQTRSTLMVVGVALVMFMLFNGTMTWLRQYLVLHTGNRIDAVLGAQVFQHLLRLPVAYFDARPTGVLVARMQGVEDIRQFVSGAAVSLFLDIPFLFIFLAVMYFYSWQLTLIAAGILLLIAVLSLIVTPIFRARLNQQFQLGARNQAFVTEYLAGIHTVKSLQFEPVLESKYGGFLSFRYSPQHPYLYRNLSLALQPGRLTVLMGPSGCGKSTLTKLLQGFYPPTDGTIKIDGTDLSYLSANELRQAFGVVPQETVLYSGTVYDNLLMADPHASFEDIIAAAELAEIHPTIEQLPQGYQTLLGERGVGLSGGQRQRIAIARALLKQPKVLIFDEATSGLDAATVEHFVGTVNALKGKVTILFITHHLPPGLQVDEVYRFGAKAQAAASTMEQV